MANLPELCSICIIVVTGKPGPILFTDITVMLILSRPFKQLYVNIVSVFVSLKG